MIVSRRRQHGQITTFLLVIIAAVLLFAVMTANLGQLAIRTTTLSNATDASALFLGSQLATKSRQLYEHLEYDTEKCVSSGILGPVLGGIFALLTVITIGATAPIAATVLAGTAAGAAGGAIGNAIIGMDAGAGALQGALIGAAIGAGAVIGAEIGEALAATEAGAAGGEVAGEVTGEIAGEVSGELSGEITGELAGGELAGDGAGSLLGGESAGYAGGEGATFQLAAGPNISPEAMSLLGPGNIHVQVAAYGEIPSTLAQIGTLTQGSVLSSLAPLELGSVVGGAMTGGMNIYTESVRQRIRADAIAVAAKSLNAFPERLRIEQGTMLEALARVVDDPNEVPDVTDVNGNGNTEEMIPVFSLWWDARINNGLLEILPGLATAVHDFVTGPLATFRSRAQASYASTGLLARGQMEGTIGPLEKLLSDLSGSDFAADITFWEPGPSQAEYDDATECDACTDLPDGWDAVDEAIEDFIGFVVLAESIEARDFISNTASWESWGLNLYNPNYQPGDETIDYYHAFGNTLNGDDEYEGMYTWRARLRDIREALPQCTYLVDEAGVQIGISNAPCQDPDRGENWATSDSDFDDEFEPVDTALTALIEDVETFRTDARGFIEAMNTITDTAFSPLLTLDMVLGTVLPGSFGALSLGGRNPTTYSWEDSRGQHSVSVVVGPFRVARLEKKEHGGVLNKKICIEMVDYQDPIGQLTWVGIKRTDPTDTDFGFWTWNAYDGVTTRSASAGYSYNQVGLTAFSGVVQLVNSFLGGL